MPLRVLRAVLDVLRAAKVRGALGVVLVFVAAGSLNLWAMPILAPNDEARHMGYAMALAEGRIPHVLEPIDLEATKLGYLRGTNIQAAAAHPPLYHALVALPLKASANADKIWVGVRFARVLSLLFGVASVLYAFRLLRSLLPGRDDLSLSATALVACFPVYVGSSSIAYGDSLGALAFVATLSSTVDVALKGMTVRRYALACFWFAVASLTRLPVLVSAAPALLALGLPRLLSSQGSLGRRLAKASVPVLGAGLSGALAGGWFYVLNIRRYGDPSASAPLLARLEREPIPVGDLLLSTDWQRMLEYQWGSLIGMVRKYPFGAQFARVLLYLVVSGLVIHLVRLVRERRAGVARPRAPAPHALTFARAIAAACVFACVALLFVFRSKGGLMTARYTMPFAWAIGLLVAFAMSWPRRPIYLQTVLSAALFLLHVTITQYAPETPSPTFDDTRLGLALHEAGIPYPETTHLVHCGVLLLGGALIVSAVGTLYRCPRAEDPS